MTHDGSERLDFQALYSLLIETLTGYVEDFVAQLPAMLAALLIVVLFALLARWIARAASRLVGSLSDSEAVVRLCASLARIATLLGGVFIALNVLQLHNAVMSLLAGAGVVGLALGFAFQDLAANLIAGVYLGFRFKFDEDLFGRGRRGVDPSVTPAPVRGE